MKKSVILFVIVCGVIAGALVYLKKQKTSPPPAPAAETAPTQPGPQQQEVVSTPKPEPVSVTVSTNPAPAPAAVATPVVAENNSNDATNSIRKSVDALLSAKSGLDKHNLFLQLAKDGQLDAAIDELKQRAAANPTDAEIPTTLGEALLNKVRAMHDAGITDPTELGILALQADQQFNAAIKIDPKNWEAQFVKSSTVFYWPPDAQRDGAAAQTLASLIDQQETMPSRPEFAQTYLALGNQYQKMGKTAEAIATWQLGAQKFPSDPALQQKLAGQ
jgi:tetratricopeptide (TPR) repeat protein